MATSFGESTGMGGEVPKGVDEKTAAEFQVAFKKTLAGSEGKMQQGEEIADVILEAITSKKAHLCYSTNPQFDSFLKQKYTDLTGDSVATASTELFKLPNEP